MLFTRFRLFARRFVIGSLLASLACGAVEAAPKNVVPKNLAGVAPADQYFGPLKISIPGMAARMKDLGERYHAREISDTDIVHDAKLVEAALDVWRSKYPTDPGLPRIAFRLEQLYQVVQSTNARTHATTMLQYIAKYFPKSHEAHLSRLRLAQGFPPLQAETPTHATPSPYSQASPPAASPAATSASPSGSPSPSESGSPSALASPIATSTPTGTAIPGAAAATPTAAASAAASARP